MATKIRKKTSRKQVVRFKHKKRIRGKVEGSEERPRLAVFRSNTHLYVQLIDDLKKVTIASASTLEEELKAKVGNTIAGAKAVGQLIAKRAMSKNVSKIVFDRSGYLYHGRIQAIADAAREAGLKF